MITLNSYYTYAYLRKDGTPYYIGKGKGYRYRYKHKQAIKVPPLERIIFLKKNLTEEEAFKHEVYMIAVLGRKDLGTGILRNITNGGEGSSGWRPSEETRKKMSISRTGKKQTPEAIEKTRQALTGRKRTPEQIQRIRENAIHPKGWFWITDGEQERWVAPDAIIPANWEKGRKKVSEETLEKMGTGKKGSKNPMFGVKPKSASMRWYNIDNLEENMFVPGEQPEGWVLGRKKKVRLSALA